MSQSNTRPTPPGWLTTRQLLEPAQEAGCFATTAERKYYALDGVFIKRSLRRREWKLTLKGTTHVPRLGPERLVNEAAAMAFVAAHTDIPVPRLICSFEDDGAVYLIEEYIDGVNMADLSDAQKDVVKREIRAHLETLHVLRSRRLGAPDPRAGLVVPPYRALRGLLRDDCAFPEAEAEEYVFCHNDLSQHNVIVDPQTLKITAIVDWEYAGFWPARFERAFFERPGPSVALEGEVDDADEIVHFIETTSL